MVVMSFHNGVFFYTFGINLNFTISSFLLIILYKQNFLTPYEVKYGTPLKKKARKNQKRNWLENYNRFLLNQKMI